MRYSNKIWTSVTALLLAPVLIFGQTFLASDGIIIRSDSSSKFALISNLFDRRGDSSQLLASGTVCTDKESLECRSLLAFDFSQLPADFKSDKISNATLVLFPMQLENETPAVNETATTIIVKRIMANWNDTTVRWSNQPLTDEKNIASKKVKTEKKGDAVKIDVTKLVRKMLKEGNKGFMVTYADETSNSDIAWFASSKNIQKIARPMLVIELPGKFAAPPLVYEPAAGTPMAQNRVTELDAQIRFAEEELRRLRRPAVTTATPPPAPVKDVPLPASTPSKD